MSTEINSLNTSEISSKKKVLFVITQYEFGGAQRFLYNIASRLDKSRYEIKIAVGDTGNKEFIQALKDLDVSVFELKFLVREINPLKDIMAVLELKKLITRFEPNTIFLNSSKAGFIGSLAATLLRHSTVTPKVIYRIGGWTFNDPWPKWKKKLWIILERLSARWKDYIIVNNKHDLEQAHKFKIKPRKNVLLVHNGLDVYKTDLLPREEAREKLKISKPNSFVIGTIGNFYPSKGLDYLIETAEYFKNSDDIVFIIIGDGKERMGLENMIKEKGLQNKVLLSGQIPDASKFLSAFDVFVLPSVKEGFPWVVIEAMAAKLPVIATGVGAVPEIIENGKNGFIVEPARPEKIAERVQELLGDDRLRQEMGIQAHQTVLFKFPIEKMIKEIEDNL